MFLLHIHEWTSDRQGSFPGAVVRESMLIAHDGVDLPQTLVLTTQIAKDIYASME